MLEMLVLQSVAWSVLGNADRATAKLGQALDLAGPDGPVLPFVDTVGFTASSLRALRGDGPRRAMIGRILEAADQVPEATPAPTCRAKDDTLHRREAEILELVSQGLRNREIGKRLFLSEETVKWYLKRLFGKLTVRTRTEALAAARKKGLLA